MSESDTTAFEPITLRFPHSKDDLRRITVKDGLGEYEVYRISPSAENWPAERVPDRVNPRSHDEACLKSKVAKDIEQTLRDEPQDFWLANRGGFLLVDRVKFDPERSQLEIALTDDTIHGIADGGTTNAVIAKLRREANETKDEVLVESLRVARFNMDVVVGLSEHDRVAKLVQGRNRSVQVKEWSLNDFRGGFDWLKDYIDRPDGPFRGKIGWEENASAPWSVLDLISVMTLFHPTYSSREKRRRGQPTAAFSAKGGGDKRLLSDDMADGYKSLKPVLEDILRLHDNVYAGFEPAYEEYNLEVNGKRSKAGRRRGIENRAIVLPMTGTASEYRVDKGLLFPLLAAHRALLEFGDAGVQWREAPQPFFDEFGPDLVGRLIEEYEKLGRNPATVGKNKSVYEGLFEKAENILMTQSLAVAAE
jgi:AIPR protein